MTIEDYLLMIEKTAITILSNTQTRSIGVPPFRKGFPPFFKGGQGGFLGGICKSRLPRWICQSNGSICGVLILLLILCSLCAYAQTGKITGVVLQRGSREPVPQVKVALGATEQDTLTDSSGSFIFDEVTPGEYQITVVGIGYKSEDHKVKVAPGETVQVKIYLEKSSFLLDGIVVTAPRPTKTISRQTLSSDEIKRIPGTGGDALRALQSLPGVAVMNDFSGQLYIRGGAPEDNLFLFDRIFLFYPYHFGGLVSTLNTDIIDKIDVFAGGFGAEFGADSQAVVDILSRAGRKDRFGSKANINMLMSEILLEGPIGQRCSWYLAGRRSYIDLFPIEVEQITAFPRFWDYQLKFDYDITAGQHLSFNAFGSDDFMALRIKEEDVTDNPEFAGNFHYKNAFHTQGLHLQSIFSEKLSSKLSISHIPYLLDIKFGKGYFIRIEPDMYSVQDDIVYKLTPKCNLETGLVLSSGMLSIKSFFTRPPEEGDPSYDFSTATKIEMDTEERFTYAEGYSQWRYSPLETISLALGGRLDYFNLTDAFSLEPRASLSLELPIDTKLRFAWGQYLQSPQPFHIMTEWGNPGVKDSTATHYILEAERQLSADTILKVACYYKKLADLITQTEDDRRYLNQGRGFARGAEIFLKHEIGERFFGWLSYAYSRSRRQDAPSEPERLYSFDQTHVATLTGSYKLTPMWEIGAKWHYSTGTPYTPITCAEVNKFYHPKTGETRCIVPTYGEINSERIPSFHRLDVRINKSFIFDRWQMALYLEVLNLYNRKNVLTIDYNDDYSKQEAVHQLPIIPYFGMTMEF